MSARRSSHRDDRRDAGGGGSGRVSRDDMDRLADRVDRMHGLLDSTGRLALQTAHRIGSASAQRSLVFFCKGGVKQDLATAWASWKSTSRLAPGDRPPVRPPLHGDNRWRIASWPTWPQQGGRPWNWQPIWKPFKRCQWQLKPFPMASHLRSPSGTLRTLSCCGKTSCMSAGARSKVATKSWAGGPPDTCPLGLLGQFSKGLASTKAVGRESVGVPSGRGPIPHHRLQLAGSVPEGPFLPLCRVDCLLPLAVVWCREVLPSLTCYQRVPSLLVWFG